MRRLLLAGILIGTAPAVAGGAVLSLRTTMQAKGLDGRSRPLALPGSRVRLIAGAKVKVGSLVARGPAMWSPATKPPLPVVLKKGEVLWVAIPPDALGGAYTLSAETTKGRIEVPLSVMGRRAEEGRRDAPATGDDAWLAGHGVTVGEPILLGATDPDTLRPGFQAALPAFGACRHAWSGLPDPGEPTLVVELVVRPDGSVAHAATKRGPERQPAWSDCVLAVARSVRLPPLESDERVVTAPILTE